MSLIVVDVESDGPVPPIYSMICFAAVLVTPTNTHQHFYEKVKPISSKWIPNALAISGYSREQHATFRDPEQVMKEFANWLKGIDRPTFISDNPAYDWSFMSYYLHRYTGGNPFGFSARRIGDIYCGYKKDMGVNKEWKRLYRKTKHSHNPLDDCKGNVEALQAFQRLGIKGIK